MDNKQIKKKGLNDNNLSSVEADLELINKHTIKPLTSDEVYTFKVQICDNDVDRVGDKMTDNFLEQVADNITGVTGLKDHDWSVENQLARLYDAEVVTDDSKLTVLGEPRKYVLGKAYTLSKYKDYIDSINAGLLKETSISFESSGDVCSICGEPMIKDDCDIGHCKNGHIAGHYYDSILCYNKIDKLEDVLEWSLVAVPCQRNAGIKNKNLYNGGNSIMKKAEYLIRQFMSSKAYKEADDDDKATLNEATESEDVELSEEDIRKIVDENSKLKAQIKELEGKIKEVEDGRERDKIETIVSKAIDDMKPLTPKVKSMIMKELPWDNMKLEEDKITGLDDVFNDIKEQYKGLLEEVDTKSSENDNIETKEFDTSEVENKELETPEVDNKADETEVRSKGLKRPSGIQFGVTSKSYNETSNKASKPGIYFN